MSKRRSVSLPEGKAAKVEVRKGRLVITSNGNTIIMGTHIKGQERRLAAKVRQILDKMK